MWTVFLDIEPVLQPVVRNGHVDTYAFKERIKAMNYILEGFQVVVTSDFRLTPDAMKEAIDNSGIVMNMVDVLPDYTYRDRGILHYTSQHDIEDYLVLDGNPSSMNEIDILEHVVQLPLSGYVNPVVGRELMTVMMKARLWERDSLPLPPEWEQARFRSGCEKHNTPDWPHGDSAYMGQVDKQVIPALVRAINALFIKVDDLQEQLADVMNVQDKGRMG